MSSRATRGRGKPLTPLSYMLMTINDASASPSRRDRMAMFAAPYVHPRAAAVGKKARVAAAAAEAGAGTDWADDLEFRVNRASEVKRQSRDEWGVQNFGAEFARNDRIGQIQSFVYISLRRPTQCPEKVPPLWP